MEVKSSSGNFKLMCNGHWDFGSLVDVLRDPDGLPIQAILASPAQVCAMYPTYCKGNYKHVVMNYANTDELCLMYDQSDEMVSTTDWYQNITPSGQVTGGCELKQHSP
jgi:hypothetical protein